MVTSRGVWPYAPTGYRTDSDKTKPIVSSVTRLNDGFFNLITGFIFGIPLAVQPMKAIGTIAINEGLTVNQILTTLNSVIAVCALSWYLFPKKGADTRKMATSVGLMNLIGCWFGAMPMCHGSGGLAAQYGFGARTGGSIVFLGIMTPLSQALNF